MITAYGNFFAVLSTGAATLVGLLFVALSIDVGLEHEFRVRQFVLSETAFISLSGIFIISLLALLPSGQFFMAVAAILLALFGISDLGRVNRAATHTHYPRDLWYISITIGAYFFLALNAISILRYGASGPWLASFATLLVILAGLSLLRAWRALLITKRNTTAS